MIDHIGGKHLSIRQINNGVGIRQLKAETQLILDADEWFELCGLVRAIIAATDFKEAYGLDGSGGIA